MRTARAASGVARLPSLDLANRAAALNELCRFEEAAALCLAAIGSDPRCWAAWCNLGNAMAELQRYDDAIAALDNCLRINPGAALALSNMGVVLFRRGDPRLACTFLELAVAADPRNAETRCNLAQALLAAGDYTRGFAEYEWRWQTRAMTPHGVPGPRWSGEAFAGKTLLLHEEGGFGDTLQFIRYAPLVKARGGRVILRARAPLVSLLARLEGIDEIIPGEAGPVDPRVAHDLQCPLLSLAHVFGTTPDTVPSPGAYLTADPARVARWRSVLAAADGGDRMRVGLVWAGAPRPGQRAASLADLRRSTALATFEPLAAQCPDIAFHSLQLGAAGCEASSAAFPLHDLTAGIADFDDTAALVTLLDLVIAVDTSTAHLGAALGRPVWLLSRYDQCWRWLAGRRDTPWYRSMRIFRQAAPFDWSRPIAEMADALERLVQEGASSLLPV